MLQPEYNIQAEENQDPIAGQQTSSGKKTRTFGNKAFDWAVWPAVQWVGVWGISLILANAAQNGKGVLNKWYDAGVKWLTPRFKAFDSPTAKKIWGHNTGAKQWAGSLALFTALFMGGNISLPILKYFEDRREKISSWFDGVFHKPTKAPEEIAKEPKQTWASVIKGRLSAALLGYSVFFALGPGRAGKVQDSVGGAATKLFMKIRPQANEKTVSKWANLAVFDLLFTAIAASFHYATSRIFARHGQKEDSPPPAEDISMPKDSQSAMEETAMERKTAPAGLKNSQQQQKYTEGWAKGEDLRRNLETASLHISP